MSDDILNKEAPVIELNEDGANRLIDALEKPQGGESGLDNANPGLDEAFSRLEKIEKGELKVTRSGYIDRKLLVIYMIAKMKKPSPASMSELSGIPKSTIKRLIGDVRSDFKIIIDFEREKGAHGKVGFYKISDWGFVSKKKFMEMHSEAFSPILGE